ncbi:VOC family protein [Streptomyces sp. NBC_00111]|uniref:VOC family protein n=1 Tax=unclassified Streptomyces TaxID=2593676 RepID=UPI002E34529F|nr:VOC family protein [Streptomyces sp. NBC_01460]
MSRTRTATERPTGLDLIPELHHVGVQTGDLDNCLAWYQEFFGCRPNWTLDAFSDLTLSRLPGITRLTELAVAGLRFHLFERTGHDDAVPGGNTRQFQHICLSTGSAEELRAWRDRWIHLYDSGRYTFAGDEQPTDIVIDADGVQSCYVLDVNGLEFEFTYVPPGGDR